MIWLFGLALADCPAPQTNQSLSTQMSQAEASVKAFEFDRFQSQLTEINSSVGCVTEVLNKKVVAQLHRLRGISAFGAKDARAELDFAAARAADPTYSFPDYIAPPSSPLRSAYDAFKLEEGVWEPFATKGAGHYVVDGDISTSRSATLPGFIQFVALDGSIEWTVHSAPNAELPPIPELVTPPPPGEEGPTEPLVVHSPKAALLGGAFVTAVAAGGLYGGALITRAQWNSSATPYSNLPTLHQQTNGLVISSGLVAAASAGLFAGGLAAKSKKKRSQVVGSL